MIPIKYNIRNLRVRWKTTLLTVLATGLVVWSSCILFGMVEGLEYSLTISGDPLDLIVLRKGSSNEVGGGFSSDKADELLNLPGIARDEQGKPLAAKELLNIPLAERSNGTRTNIILRGVQPASRKLRPDFKIVDGKDFDEGKGECIVSRKLSRSFKGAQVGGVLNFGDKEIYRVVGTFSAGGSAAESEIWADLKDVEKNTGRDGSVSSVQIRAASPDDYARLRKTIDDDTQFKLAAIPESLYFESQSRSGAFLKVVGTLIAVSVDLRRHVRRGQHHVRRRQIPHARDRHDAGPGLFAVRYPDLVPERIAHPLHPGRLAGTAGDRSALAPDARDQQFQHLRLGLDLIPLRPAGHDRRPGHDAGHGRLRRNVPRAAGRAAGCDLGAARSYDVLLNNSPLVSRYRACSRTTIVRFAGSISG